MLCKSRTSLRPKSSYRPKQNIRRKRSPSLDVYNPGCPFCSLLISSTDGEAEGETAAEAERFRGKRVKSLGCGIQELPVSEAEPA
jgi:hypothetical protein